MNDSLIMMEKGFQTSVNIAYDLNNPQKIKSLIPTREVIGLLEDIILSTDERSTRRARFLIGAYGRGKSHIVLVILSILFSKKISLYHSLLEKIQSTNPDLYEYVMQYLNSDKKLLPVVIDGNSDSMTQSFLSALYKTLQYNGLSDLMPDTHFKAATHMIELWKEKFPATYQELEKLLEQPVSIFVEKLTQYDVASYKKFVELYPALTAGSEFNPFSGFNVVEIFDYVNQKLAEKGYSGIYVVYDEFSKYLEANITTASAGDVKMLQDFAEKCCRSGRQQLHLLLILHKEIENYIDQLPKQKVDGWRGVSERFAHVVMQSDYKQTYEVISHAIRKSPQLWLDFQKKNQLRFEFLENIYTHSTLFKDCDQGEIRQIIYGGYPLHPVSTFILPRLSELLAQNERTMFTFLAGSDYYTLPHVLQKNTADFLLITPDVLYDYFEPQMRKEAYTTDVNRLYKLTARVLHEHSLTDLQAKIVKTIALVYVLGQFECIAPTVDMLFHVYCEYDKVDIEEAIQQLIKQKCIIYLKRSNAYLKIKENVGINVFDEIRKTELRRSKFTTADILNQINLEPYCYPTRYNDDHAMVRFFAFQFIDSNKLETILDENSADGTLYAVIPSREMDVTDLEKAVIAASRGRTTTVFAIHRPVKNLAALCREFDAVSFLRRQAEEDLALFDEYDTIYQDLMEVMHDYIAAFLHPEYEKTDYFYDGKQERLYRKSNFSELLSSICEKVYPETPIINNEMLNKNELTSMAIHSREKLLNGIIRDFQRPGFGLSGSGQEISFLRSSLMNTGILKNLESVPEICLVPEDTHISRVFSIICDFIESGLGKKRPLKELYDSLTGKTNGIGMRKGVLPIFLVIAMKAYQGHVILSDKLGMECPFEANTFTRINNNPEKYFLLLEQWDQDKEKFIGKMKELFSDYSQEQAHMDGYGSIAQSMHRWYLSLPKYVKEIKKAYKGKGHFENVPVAYTKFITLMNQTGIGAQQILFEKIPAIFGYEKFTLDVFDDVKSAKFFFDSVEISLSDVLIQESKDILMPLSNHRASLLSICQQWFEQLPDSAKTFLYPDNAERLLQVVSEPGNDEYALINRLAHAMTSLRIKDWNNDTALIFTGNLRRYSRSILDYAKAQADVATTKRQILAKDFYEVLFCDSNGKQERKTFKREVYSKKAKLLYNDIESSIEEMGQSITPQEKRQVLMDLLEKLL